MECTLCKKIVGNDEKNIVIKHNNNNYCVGCYDVIFLFGDDNEIKQVKIQDEKPIEKPLKVVNNYKCPRCKIPMEKNCLKCKLKNPMWR